MTRRPIGFLLVIMALFTIVSCRKDLNTGWDTRYKLPIVTGELDLYDLVPDSLTVIGDDQSVTLVYKTELLDYDLTEEAIEIPDTSVEYFVSLDSLSLEDQDLTIPISLGQIAIDLGFPYGTLIIAANGTEVALDPIYGLSTDPTPVDATTFFETATFQHAYLDISLANGLPVDLDTVVFSLKNSVGGETVVYDTFFTVPAGGVPVVETYDLSGMTVEGNLLGQIAYFSTPGSADPVLIDTSDVLVIDMRAYDMELQEAVAVFPEQNLINNANDVQYDMGGPEFTTMGIEEGYVVIYVENTIGDTIHIVYDIPGAVDALGNHVHIETAVGPDEIVDQAFDIAGYTIDLTGTSGNEVNTFYQEFSARINYTGIPTHISLDDSLRVIYGLENIVPNELRGYLGQYEIAMADTTAGVDLFDQFTGGTIEFGDINIDLEIENGLGAGGVVTINSLGGINSETGEVIMLDCPAVIGTPISVNRAIDNPYVPGYTTITLNSANSNINDLIEMFPDKLFYDVSMSVNPNGNEFNYQDFVISTSKINISFNLSMPLEFMANDLTLESEFPVTLDADGGTDGIGDIDLTLYADNSFPLNASVSIVFYDDFGVALDTLNFGGYNIKAGELSDDCRVHTPMGTELHQLVDGTMKDAVLNAANAKATVTFNTESIPTCSDIVKIYSDYTMKIQLVGDINYTLSTSDF
ncbi:MAG TPA: hypothetical protein PK511_08305 [Chitinophagales bacterium]|nr:hypothetical protein [Chitinophagales bacterium]HNI54508.1 hypothetical protein [Chitinophagales bacterium]